MKHICMFSGGASSAYMSWLVAKEHPDDTILLHTPTYSEHPDADRFRQQVADYIGLPITVQEDGRDIWELIDEEGTPPSYWIPYCTRILKAEQQEKFIRSIDDDFILYFGYGKDEIGRVQNATARLERMGRKSEYPIFERQISEENIRGIIMREWKICLPEPYLYLKHNNCIPCFKGGKGHFYEVWKHYPEQFWKASEKEKQTGYTVFKDASLDELAHLWELQGEQIIFDEFDNRPCMCAF